MKRTQKNSLRRATAVAAGLLALLCSIPSSIHSQEPERAGEIEALKPRDFILRGLKIEEAKKNSPVYWQQDIIRTEPGGRVRIRLDDGSTLNIGSDALVQIVKHDAASQQTDLVLRFGKMRATVRKLTRPDSRFEIRTNTAVAGVIGSDIYVESTPTLTTVTCLEGVVAVRSSDATIPDVVYLYPGETTSIEAGQPPQPKRRATPQELQEILDATLTDPDAALPSLTTTQGTVLDATISGENLLPLDSIAVSDEGVTVEVLDGATDSQIPIRVIVGSDAPTGAYTYTLQTEAAEFSGELVVTPQSSFTFQLEPTLSPDAPLEAGPGTTSDPVRLEVVPLGGFTGTVELAVTDAADGITPTLSAPSVEAGESAELSFAVSEAAAVGDYTVAIEGSTPEFTTTTSLYLRVSTAAAVAPVTATAASFDLQLDPSVTPETPLQAELGGDTEPVQVDVVPLGGFTGTVELSLGQMPEGVTAELETSTVEAGEAAVLTFTAAETVTAGDYAFVLLGTSANYATSIPLYFRLGAASGVTPLPPVTEAPLGFELQLDPASTADRPLQVDAGGSTAPAQLDAVPLGGFTGTVELSLGQMPVGITADLSSAQVEAGQSVELSFAATEMAAAGDYAFVLLGQSPDYVTTQSVYLRVTRPEAAEGPAPVTQTPAGFDLQLDPLVDPGSPLEVGLGESTDPVQVNVLAQGGFAGRVELSVGQMPEGVTAALSAPIVETGQSVELTVTADWAADPGEYAFVVLGASPEYMATAAVYLRLWAVAPSEPPVSAEPANFTLELDPTITPDSPLVGNPGEPTTPVQVEILPSGGFSGPVDLSVAQVPSGISASLGASTVEAGRSTDLTLAASETAEPGDYALVLLGTAPESVATKTIYLRFGAAPTMEADVPTTAAAPAPAIETRVEHVYSPEAPPETLTGTSFRVLQGALLHLDASASTVAEGEITGFEWQVVGQPFSGSSPEFPLDTWRLSPGNYEIELVVTSSLGATARQPYTLAVEELPNPDDVLEGLRAAYETLQVNQYLSYFDSLRFRGYPGLEESIRDFFQDLSEARVYLRIDNRQLTQDDATYQAVFQVEFRTQEQPDLAQERTESLTLRQLLLRSPSEADWKIVDYAVVVSEDPDAVISGGVEPSGGPAGAQPTLAFAVNPTAVDFGNVLVTTVSSPQTVTVDNIGTDDLIVDSIDLSSLVSPFSLVLPSLPGTVSPNSSLSFNVSFSPVVVGSFTNTISIETNAGSASLPLTGNGALPAGASFTVLGRQGAFFNRSFGVPAGGSAIFDVEVLPANGFLGTVDVELANLPPGVTATPSVATAQITSGLPELVSFTVQADPGVDTGGAVFATVMGQSGTLTSSTEFLISVGTPTFELTLESGGASPGEPINIEAGSTAEVAFSLEPLNGFEGSIDLAISGTPGIIPVLESFNIVFASEVLPRDTFFTDVQAAPEAPGGAAQLTVTATGGTISKTLTVFLNVQTVEFSTVPTSITTAGTPLTIDSVLGASFDVVVTPQGGFNRSITITPSGVPTGFSISPNPAVVNAGPQTVTFTYTFVSGTPLPETGSTVLSTSIGKDLEIFWNVDATSNFQITTSPVGQLNPDPLIIPAGTSQTVDVTVHPQNGLTGTVNLAVLTDLSAQGIATSLSPGSVNLDGVNPVTVVLTLTASPTASVPSATPITIQGTHPGTGLTASAFFDILSTGPADFIVFATNSTPETAAEVVRATSGPDDIEVQAAFPEITVTPVNGFSDPVDISVQTTVPGVFIDPSPKVITFPTGASKCTLAVRADASAPLGLHQIDVTLTGGTITKMATIWINITDPTMAPSNTPLFSVSPGTSQAGPLELTSGEPTEIEVTVPMQPGLSGPARLRMETADPSIEVRPSPETVLDLSASATVMVRFQLVAVADDAQPPMRIAGRDGLRSEPKRDRRGQFGLKRRAAEREDSIRRTGPGGHRIDEGFGGQLDVNPQVVKVRLCAANLCTEERIFLRVTSRAAAVARTEKAQPDLVVRAAEIRQEPRSIRMGEPVEFRVPVHNRGELAARRVSVEFTIPELHLQHREVVDLEAGETVTVVFATEFSPQDFRRPLRPQVVVDPDRALEDVRRDNNRAVLLPLEVASTQVATNSLLHRRRASLLLGPGECVGFRFSGGQFACGQGADIELRASVGGHRMLLRAAGVQVLNSTSFEQVQELPRSLAGTQTILEPGRLVAVQTRSGETSVMRLAQIRRSRAVPSEQRSQPRELDRPGGRQFGGTVGDRATRGTMPRVLPLIQLTLEWTGTR